MVVGLGAGAFVAGWHLVRAQERLSAKARQEVERVKLEKRMVEEQMARLEEILEKEKQEKEQLKEKLREMENQLEEREEEITRLKLLLAEKSQGHRRGRVRRSRMLE